MNQLVQVQLQKNRLFTQFHAQYPEYERERIVKELVAGSSKLRLLFVTVAFGIGVDVNNIRRVIHIGVPHSIEEFYQEAGRCGRDGLPASSIVYFNSYDISTSRHISHHMEEFVTSNMCKREKILSYFGHTVPVRTPPHHLCCDFHEQRCCCDDCLLSSASSMFERNTIADNDKSTPTCGSEASTDTHTTALSSEQKTNLIEHLMNYRHSLHGSGKSCVGSVSLCTGFSMGLIDLVVEHASELSSIEEVKSKLPIFDSNHAVVIFEILNTIRTTSV